MLCFLSIICPFAAPTEDLSGVKITMDDSHPELRLALNKVRRLKDKLTVENKWDINEIARSIKKEPLDEPEPMDEDSARNNIVLNATAEFCRTLGDIPTYGMAGNRDEDEEELQVRNKTCKLADNRMVILNFVLDLFYFLGL